MIVCNCRLSHYWFRNGGRFNIRQPRANSEHPRTIQRVFNFAVEQCEPPVQLAARASCSYPWTKMLLVGSVLLVLGVALAASQEACLLDKPRTDCGMCPTGS